MTKTINRTNININQIWAHKRFSITETNQSSYSVTIQSGSKSLTQWTEYDDTNLDGTYKSLVYDSINRLYYDNTHDTYINLVSYDFVSKSINDEIMVCNIPQEIYGLEIQSGSILLESGSISITDDNHYNLISGSQVVGNIFYQTGQLVITEPTLLNIFEDYQLQFESTIKVKEYSVLCNVNQTEFNYTLNSTAFNSGSYLEELQSGDLSPYITSVGLYNDANELVAIAKFPRPIKKPNDIDLSFLVKFDY